MVSDNQQMKMNNKKGQASEQRMIKKENGKHRNKVCNNETKRTGEQAARTGL